MATSRRNTATAPARPPLKGRLSLETPLGGVLSESRIRLLEAIDRVGSLNRAAREVPLSYKAAWDALDTLNRHAPEPLVERSTGGAGGGGTRLTPAARQLIALYRAMESSQQDVLDQLKSVPTEGDAPALRTLIRRMTMKTSARNQFAARVTGLNDRGGLVDVQLDLGGGDHIVATITPESATRMGLGLDTELYALIKAPWVQVQTQAPRRQAGRNTLAGTLTALRPGQARTGATLTLPSGRQVEGVTPPPPAVPPQPGQPAWARFDSESVVLVTFE